MNESMNEKTFSIDGMMVIVGMCPVINMTGRQDIWKHRRGGVT
jgi:hypothetical protein